MLTLIIATRNAHKLEEIRSILGNQFRYLALNDFPGTPEVIEDAGTFAGNATKKAVELAKWFRLRGNLPLPLGEGRGEGVETWVLADDSGLEVDALHGAPGVHSARFAALDTGQIGNSGTAENNAKLLRLLGGVPPEKRTARFRCVLALTPIAGESVETASPVCSSDEAELRGELFEGICEGRIGLGPSGQGGFGYDPLFIPSGHKQTFAELGEEVKNQLSHRGHALKQLKQRLGAVERGA